MEIANNRRALGRQSHKLRAAMSSAACSKAEAKGAGYEEVSTGILGAGLDQVNNAARYHKTISTPITSYSLRSLSLRVQRIATLQDVR